MQRCYDANASAVGAMQEPQERLVRIPLGAAVEIDSPSRFIL
jgi:hypothetical protein